jgi:hypothetical protein
MTKARLSLILMTPNGMLNSDSDRKPEKVRTDSTQGTNNGSITTTAIEIKEHNDDSLDVYKRAERLIYLVGKNQLDDKGDDAIDRPFNIPK